MINRGYKIEWCEVTKLGQLWRWDGWIRGKWTLLREQEGLASLYAAETFFSIPCDDPEFKPKLQCSYYDAEGKREGGY